MNHVFLFAALKKQGIIPLLVAILLVLLVHCQIAVWHFVICKSAVTWCKCFIALGIHSQSSIKEVFTFLQIKKQKIPNKLGLKVTLTEECQSNYFFSNFEVLNKIEI